MYIITKYLSYLTATSGTSQNRENSVQLSVKVEFAANSLDLYFTGDLMSYLSCF